MNFDVAVLRALSDAFRRMVYALLSIATIGMTLAVSITAYKLAMEIFTLVCLLAVIPVLSAHNTFKRRAKECALEASRRVEALPPPAPPLPPITYRSPEVLAPVLPEWKFEKRTEEKKEEEEEDSGITYPCRNETPRDSCPACGEYVDPTEVSWCGAGSRVQGCNGAVRREGQHTISVPDHVHQQCDECTCEWVTLMKEHDWDSEVPVA